MNIHVTIAGSNDNELTLLLRESGATTSSLRTEQLAELAAPGARQPDVVLMDLREQTELPQALGQLKRQHPTTAVVLIATNLEPAFMLEALRLGVNEVVTEASQVQLEAAFTRLVALRPAPPAGRVFAFVGAKGGTGTTTVAVNVATALATTARGKTLLIDLHPAYGDAAMFLGADPKFSVVDAMENVHRLDAAFFGGLVTRTTANVDLLASSDRSLVAPFDTARVRTVVEFAARHYPFVVLDVPHSDSAALDALESVTRIVVVSSQELGAVRNAARMASMLRQRYGKDAVGVVISRTDHDADIGQEDIERLVGGRVRFTIPSDYRRALYALNKGRPLTLDNHNQVSSSLQALARDLAGLAAAPGEQRSGRLFGRFGVGRR